jgi:integrase/recombinase XerC
LLKKMNVPSDHPSGGSGLVLANPFGNKGNRKGAAARAAHLRDLEALMKLIAAHLNTRNGSNSANTLAAYRKGVRAFLGFSGGENLVELTQVDDETIQGFRNSLLEAGLSANTVNLYLAAVGELYAALRWAKVTSNTPLEGVSRAKPTVDPRDRYRALTQPEVARLLESPDLLYPADGARAARDRALLGLGFQAGLRIHEIVGFAKDSYHRPSQTLRFAGKGGKSRVVPVVKDLAVVLEHWLELNPHPSAMFVSFSLRSLGEPLSLSAGRRIVSDYLAACGLRDSGLGGIGGTHSMRRAIATETLKRTGNLALVAGLLGHANVNTTARYGKVSLEDLRQALE